MMLVLGSLNITVEELTVMTHCGLIAIVDSGYLVLNAFDAHLAAKGVQGADDLRDVLLLPKVDGLEHVNVGDAVRSDGRLEAVINIKIRLGKNIFLKAVDLFTSCSVKIL